MPDVELQVELQREAARRHVSARAAYAVWVKAPVSHPEYLFGAVSRDAYHAERVARFQLSARNAAEAAR